MAIETRIQPRQTLQNVAYGIICLALGIWGWYDYAIKIPAQEAAFVEFTAAEKVKSALEETARTTPLNEQQKAEYTVARELLEFKYKEKPAEPAAYDRAVQLWLYIVGCGVAGVPWFAWAQWQLSRKRFKLNDDGSFVSAEGTFAADQIAGIDMSKWMAKSIARVETADGRKIELDDYKYKGVEDIVATLAARFHPGEWTSDARPVGDPKSRDTIKAKQDAEAAAAASLAAEAEAERAEAEKAKAGASDGSNASAEPTGMANRAE